MSSDTITISRKEYEELIEMLAVLSDQDLMKRINKSLQEFSRGKKISFEEVKKGEDEK